MAVSKLQIRVCLACGLRFPLVVSNSLSDRCPVCLNKTDLIVEKPLDNERTNEDCSTGQNNPHLNVLLDNVRSALNVGSIIRSAGAFQFANVYLCGITPTPENPAVKKTALGAEKLITWTYHKNAVTQVRDLQRQGITIWAVEYSSDSVPLESILKSTVVFPGTNVLVVGNERTGVDPGIINRADFVVHIPMAGRKKSLNVGVAFAIAAYSINVNINQRQ